ncbi:hypothetical protein F5Y13DRAFT_191574 [Hypoxylon sp. FL1857]|nr:hypothetical protein F5Y13DRAFT_191574 [Hypoxylon sp. FL1857]
MPIQDETSTRTTAHHSLGGQLIRMPYQGDPNAPTASESSVEMGAKRQDKARGSARRDRHSSTRHNGFIHFHTDKNCNCIKIHNNATQDGGGWNQAMNEATVSDHRGGGFLPVILAVLIGALAHKLWAKRQ